MRPMLLAIAMASSVARADDPQAYADRLASGDLATLQALAKDRAAPGEIRLQAALILLERNAPETAAPATTARVPVARDDLACDEEGRVVRTVPVAGLATLVALDVNVRDDVVIVHGQLDGTGGRPLHYLLEGGSALYPSRYVVSMLGVRSGLAEPIVPVESRIVRSVEVVERDGAMIIVVNSDHERSLRADFQDDGQQFRIVLTLPTLPGA